MYDELRRLAKARIAREPAGLTLQPTALVHEVGVAIAIGGLIALAGSRALSAMLFGVTPTDWPTFLGGALLLIAVAFVASYAPARRATRVDPLIALRAE
jgi:hypothetical protein